MEKLESVSSGYLSPDERIDVNKTLYHQNFKSGLKIFKDHNGFINGEFHTFIGTKGSGKSTWSRTIISDLLYQNKNVMLYISEERKNKYLNDLNRNMFRILKEENKLKAMMDQMIVLSEIDSGFKDSDFVFTYMSEIIETCEIDILIFDNFTTSFMSELPVNTQSKILRDFKALADKYDIPILMFFHTAKLHDPKRLDGDNVRGSATAINIGSYNYLITQHKDGEDLRNFIYTEKARYHSKANKKMYEMIYNSDAGLFTDCKDYYMADYQELVSGGKKNRKGF